MQDFFFLWRILVGKGDGYMIKILYRKGGNIVFEMETKDENATILLEQLTGSRNKMLVVNDGVKEIEYTSLEFELK